MGLHAVGRAGAFDISSGSASSCPAAARQRTTSAAEKNWQAIRLDGKGKWESAILLVIIRHEEHSV